MATDAFELKINGQGVMPGTVDIADLAETLLLFRKAIAATAAAMNPDGEIKVCLVGIAEGSNKLTLTGSPSTLESAKRVTDALNQRRLRRLPPQAQRTLRDLRVLIQKKGWESCSFEGNGSGIGTAKISATDELLAMPKTFSGGTTLFGECLRTGGDPGPTALLKLLDGTKVTASLKSREMAQELGHRLYQIVGLTGVATWDAKSNKLMTFAAESIAAYSDRSKSTEKPRPIVASLRDLSRASGNRWDKVDPDEFVREQRRD